MTINMVLVLTKSSNGDEASAIFNAAAGNMIGVFLTPLLILGYLGVSGDVELVDVFYKLALRVVLPIVIGQLMRKFSPATVEFYKAHKQFFKQAQQIALVFIVYTVFCETFQQENNEYITAVDIIVMVTVQFLCLTGLMIAAWILLKLFFGNEPRLRVMGLFGCTHKTVAMGVPLINAIYENDATIGLITLPLLIWHTMQLIIGSFLAPKLSKWVDEEEKRLGINQDDDDNDVDNEENGADEEQPPQQGTAGEVVVDDDEENNDNDVTRTSATDGTGHIAPLSEENSTKKSDNSNSNKDPTTVVEC
jgi:sodium/bile acid cotransporter 7